MGLSAPQVLATEYQDVLAMFGHHRHPDYWLTDDELAPLPKRNPRGGRGSAVLSPDEREAQAEQRLAASSDLFAARRAAHAAGLPEPEPAAGSVGAIDIIAQVGVIGGDQ